MEFLLDHISLVDYNWVRAILAGLPFLDRNLLNRPKHRPRILQSLLSLLDDRELLIIADAVDALRLLGFTEALPNVLRLRNHASPFVAGSVLGFIRQHDPESARPLLENALLSLEPIVRQNGADELDELNSAASLPKLRPLLNDPDPDVREAARTAGTHLEQLQKSASGSEAHGLSNGNADS